MSRWRRSLSWLLVAFVGCSRGANLEGVGSPRLDDDEVTSGVGLSGDFEETDAPGWSSVIP